MFIECHRYAGIQGLVTGSRFAASADMTSGVLAYAIDVFAELTAET
jgi:hypothetical protein